jgi:hypothetical protein
MLKKTILARGLTAAFGGAALLCGTPLMAQDAPMAPPVDV